MSESELDDPTPICEASNTSTTYSGFHNGVKALEISNVHATLAMLSRYFVVGLINTVVGYTVILLGLRAGMGDYFANAAGYAGGLAVSYVLQRRWAFAVSTPPSYREAGLFFAAALLAYGANIGVLHVARSMGYIGSPVAQAIAMVAYSITFFILSRFVVFARVA